MSEQKKKRQKSMICLTLKLSKKISEIMGVSLWSPLSPDIKPLDYAI